MRSTGRTLIARIILTVLLLGALVFLVFRLITHDARPKGQTSKSKQTDSSKQKATEKSKSQQDKAKTTPKPQKSEPNKLPGDSTGSVPSTSTPPTTTPPVATTPNAGTAPATGKSLANSGPGDVAALFIGTVAVSALIHRRFVLSRATARQ